MILKDKFFKRIIQSSLALSLMSSAFLFNSPSMQAATYEQFSDLKGTKLYDAVKTLNKFGIVDGYEDGMFKANNSITRAELITMIVHAKGWTTHAHMAKGKTGFSDVSENHWASGYINLGVQEGIIKGYGNGKFGPEDKLTIEQATIMTIRALNQQYSLHDETQLSYLVKAIELKLYEDMPGYEVKDQKQFATRGLVAYILRNALEAPMLVPDYSGGKKTWRTSNGKTLLTEVFGVKNIEFATVIGVPLYDKDLKGNQVKIEYIGDKGGETKVVTIEPEDGNMVALLGKDLEIKLSANNEIIDYKDEGFDRMKTFDKTYDYEIYKDSYRRVREVTFEDSDGDEYTIDRNTQIYFNGSLVSLESSQSERIFDYMKNKESRMEVIFGIKDKDIAKSVYIWETNVVGMVGKEGYDASAHKLPLKKGEEYRFPDFSKLRSDQIVVLVDGKPATLSDLRENMIVSIYGELDDVTTYGQLDQNFNSKQKIFVFASGKTERGYLQSQLFSSKITIGGEEYEVGNNMFYVDTYNLTNKKVILSFDHKGNPMAIRAASGDTEQFIIYEAKDKTDGDVQLKALTLSGSEFPLTVNSDSTINRSKPDSSTSSKISTTSVLNKLINKSILSSDEWVIAEADVDASGNIYNIQTIGLVDKGGQDDIVQLGNHDSDELDETIIKGTLLANTSKNKVRVNGKEYPFVFGEAKFINLLNLSSQSKNGKISSVTWSQFADIEYEEGVRGLVLLDEDDYIQTIYFVKE